jgi:enoyl-CoA hydratase
MIRRVEPENTDMSWMIERRGRVAVVTMTTNSVNAQNQAFFADLHAPRTARAIDLAIGERCEGPILGLVLG